MLVLCEITGLQNHDPWLTLSYYTPSKINKMNSNNIQVRGLVPPCPSCFIKNLRNDVFIKSQPFKKAYSVFRKYNTAGRHRANAFQCRLNIGLTAFICTLFNYMYIVVHFY